MWAPAWMFAALVVLVASLAQWEFTRMFQRAGQPALPRLGLAAGAIVTASFLLPGVTVLAIAAAVLLVVAAPLWRPAGAPVAWQPGAVTLLGVLYVNGLLGYALPLRALPDGVDWLLLLFLVTWLGEAAAYLAGSTLGRRALAPALSPKKTVEGAAAQIVVSALAAVLAQAWFHEGLGTIEALALGALLGVVGQVGDLAESALKRSVGTKDSGGVLPGHGGMLDRIDSLLFNVPVLFCYAAWARSARRVKRLTILGATGSIGRRTLELLERFPEAFRAEGLAARGSDPDLIAEQCRRHRPRVLALSDAGAVDRVAPGARPSAARDPRRPGGTGHARPAGGRRRRPGGDRRRGGTPAHHGRDRVRARPWPSPTRRRW